MSTVWPSVAAIGFGLHLVAIAWIYRELWRQRRHDRQERKWNS